MTTISSPSIRADQQFRENLKLTLEERETHAEFVKFGLAAIARSEVDGDWIAADVVIAKLEARLAEFRKNRRTA